MTADEFLLLGIRGVFGCTQLALQKLNLLLELPLILLTLLFRRGAEMIQRLSGMLVLFFQ